MTQNQTTPRGAAVADRAGASATTTQRLLTGGVIAGPLFTIVAAIQIATRDGFDLRKLAISSLSLGDLGWIQVSNFILAGLLAAACAVGMRRALHPGPSGTWGPILIGLYGAGLVVGGSFKTDPAMGFPPAPGTPQGLPDHWTWHAQVHNFGPMLAFISLTIACFVFVRRFAALKRRGMIVYSVATALIAPTLVFTANHDTAGIMLFVASTLAFLWLSVTTAWLKTQLKERTLSV